MVFHFMAPTSSAHGKVGKVPKMNIAECSNSTELIYKLVQTKKSSCSCVEAVVPDDPLWICRMSWANRLLINLRPKISIPTTKR